MARLKNQKLVLPCENIMDKFVNGLLVPGKGKTDDESA